MKKLQIKKLHLHVALLLQKELGNAVKVICQDAMIKIIISRE